MIPSNNSMLFSPKETRVPTDAPDNFPNRKTDQHMLRRYIGGCASVACANTTRSAFVMLKMHTKYLDNHTILTAHPDGTIQLNGKDCTNTPKHVIVLDVLICLGLDPSCHFDFNFDKSPTVWSVSYFNQDVAHGESDHKDGIEWVLFGFLADATHQFAPYRISTPQNPLTPPRTNDIDSFLANRLLMPTFFPAAAYATGPYALVDLSHGQYQLWGMAYNGKIYWRSKSLYDCFRMVPFANFLQLIDQIRLATQAEIFDQLR